MHIAASVGYFIECIMMHGTINIKYIDVGSCFRQFHVDYQGPTNGSFLYCWLHRR